MKNILYVSDLDQTLLRPDARLSGFACRNLNNMIGKGLLFTIASARSVKSQQTILKDLKLNLPVIEFNGSFISDLKSGEHLLINQLERSALLRAAEQIEKSGFRFFLSTFDGNADRLHYGAATNAGEEWYVRDRKKAGDSRLHQTGKLTDHFSEMVVCLTVIDRLDRLSLLAGKLERQNAPVEIHLQENAYTPGWYWLTVHSSAATKDQAISQLRRICRLDDVAVTAFGDNTNDVKMLRHADRGIAVANSLPILKETADAIIGPNVEDSVVKFIAEENGMELI